MGSFRDFGMVSSISHRWSESLKRKKLMPRLLNLALVITLLHLVGAALSLVGCTYATIARVTMMISPGDAGAEFTQPLSCELVLGFSVPLWPILVSANEILRSPNGFYGVLVRLASNTAIVFVIVYSILNICRDLRDRKAQIQ